MVHIPAHVTDIGFSSTTAATFLSVIGLVNIGATIGGGSLGDKIGNKNATIILLFLLSISLLGFRFFSDLWILYIFAVVFGVGYSGMTAIQSPLMAEFFGLRNLGVIFSFFFLSQNLGGAAGSFFAGSIFDNTGSYNWAFLLAAILGIIALALSIIIRIIHKKR
jgi:OFA family oxalate/formate antiporter-like MFS transporter